MSRLKWVVTGLNQVRHIAAGDNHSLAITEDGRAWSWGSNAFGQLGMGQTDEMAHSVPQPIPGLTHTLALAGGWKFSLAANADSTVWAWGDNSAGQLGNGTFAAHDSPRLAENATIDGILDLDQDATNNQFPPEARPPFLLETTQSGNQASLNLSINLPLRKLLNLPKGMAADVFLSNVYVSVNRDYNDASSAQLQNLTNTSQGPDDWHPWIPPASTLDDSTFSNNPVTPFLNQVDIGSTTVGQILDAANLNSVNGAEIWIGFGNSVDEMVRNHAYRQIYNIPPPDVSTLQRYALGVTRPANGTVDGPFQGIYCGSRGLECSASYPSLKLITLVARPDTGMSFVKWEGACANQGATCTLTMDAAKTVSVSFSATTSDNRTLTVNRTGSGTVTSTPAGIDCGNSCSAGFTSGGRVALTATPATGYRFTGWSGACSGTGSCSLMMDADKTVTATFEAVMAGIYNLTVTATGGGTVVSSPVGINCGGDCSKGYQTGTVVTLTASPDSGHRFSGWSGACSGTDSCTLTMAADQVVTASFASNGCSATSQSLIYKAYIGYYARCPDQGGFNYWCERLDTQGGDLGSIISDFGTSPEYTSRFSGLSDRPLIDNLYWNLFARGGDDGGLTFYEGLLNQRRLDFTNSHGGNSTGATEYALSRIALDVLNGAAGGDVTTLNGKIAACPVY
ncbi:hypothetical protein CCP4SC76_3540001 [Gammaproteobacteria bacterium]